MDSATVAECNLDLLQNAKHCDVVFIVGPSEERIYCHQFPLMARSPVFEVMFADRRTNLQYLDGILSVQVPDVEPSVFRQIIHFIYGDVFTTKISEAIQILHVAHKYQVSQLVQKCELLMQTDIQLKDAIQIYQTARHFDLASLKQKAADLMANGFSKLVNDPSFMSIDEATLLTLLPRDDLAIDELQLFNALLRWSCQILKTPNPVSSDQRKVLEKVLPLVRFPLMKTQDFAVSVITKNILTAEESVKIFTYMNSEPGARAGVRAKLGFPWKCRRGAVSEHAIEFYDTSQGSLPFNYFPVAPQELVFMPNHNEAMEFSLVLENVNTVGSSQVDSVALASVALRGPNLNYQPNTRDSYGNLLAVPSSWTVTMQVIKKDSTRASSNAGWDCLFEKKNIEIFAQQDTVVAIEPYLDLETDGEYLIYVSFSGAVSLSNYHNAEITDPLIGTRYFQTHDNTGIYMNGLKISNRRVNAHPLSEIRSLPSEFRYIIRRGCLQRLSQSEYCAHCIRSMTVNVFSA